MTYSALSRPTFARPVARPKIAILEAGLLNKVILLALAALLGLLYLTSVTKTDALGYESYHYQEQATALHDEHNDLVLASAQMQSLDRVANSDVAANMVSVTPQQ